MEDHSEAYLTMMLSVQVLCLLSVTGVKVFRAQQDQNRVCYLRFPCVGFVASAVINGGEWCCWFSTTPVSG